MSATPKEHGRVNQKRRTRAAIIAACQELITAGEDINMPAVARAAVVSEPTAYRYFPDLASLLEEALAGIDPDPTAAFATDTNPAEPLERVAYAAELLARLVIERQSAIRALISASITRSTARAVRPGYRFALIDQALAPLAAPRSAIDAATLEQLRRDLAVVISAEAVLTLIDLYGLDPDATVASVVHTARLITNATLSRAEAGFPADEGVNLRLSQLAAARVRTSSPPSSTPVSSR
jgi:AcrR family transcriptional regulator